MTPEEIPLGLATLDDIFEWFRARHYGEPVLLIRVASEEMVVSEECSPAEVKKIGRSLVEFAKHMERDQ